MLLEKNSKKLFSRKNYTQKNKEKYIIGITGSRGIGKTSFCIMLANALKNENKILLIDFDLINSNISEIYNKKIEYEIKRWYINFKVCTWEEIWIKLYWLMEIAY